MTDSPPDEAWGFEWGTADGNGGFVRLALHRKERVAWYWAYLWRPEGGPVVVRDHDVALPRGNALEIRADSLWSELVCETPGEHWGIGLEAFGVRLDDATDALAGEIGERIALGFDFEWETTGDPFTSELAGVVYDEQPGVVQGEILLGRDRIPLDTVGRFEHSVGPVDVSRAQSRTTVACDDGSWASFRGLPGSAPASGVGWQGGRARLLDLRRGESGLGISVRASALIPAAEYVVDRGIGLGHAGEQSGAGWIEERAQSRGKIT